MIEAELQGLKIDTSLCCKTSRRKKKENQRQKEPNKEQNGKQQPDIQNQTALGRLSCGASRHPQAYLLWM